MHDRDIIGRAHDRDIIGAITEIEDLFIFVEAVPRAEGCRRDSEPPHAKAPMGVVPVPEERGRHLFHRNLRRVLKRRIQARCHRTQYKAGNYAGCDSLHRSSPKLSHTSSKSSSSTKLARNFLFRSKVPSLDTSIVEVGCKELPDKKAKQSKNVKK